MRSDDSETPRCYSESAEGVTISLKRAIRELVRHGGGDAEQVAEFVGDMGNGPYNAGDVLRWLGY